MTTKEVAETSGTTPKTVTENGKKLFPNKEVQRGKTVDWTDEEVTVLIDYMQKHPSNNAGNELILSTYKSNLSTKLTPALKIKQAMLLMQEGYEEEIARLEVEKKALIEQNTQLIEQKNAAEAETERIKQYNRNFHNSLYTATEVAKMLGVTPNRIGREAKNHNLKIEPLYGMLGKIKLSNGKLVSQFCYNDDAVRILKAIICAD